MRYQDILGGCLAAAIVGVAIGYFVAWVWVNV